MNQTELEIELNVLLKFSVYIFKDFYEDQQDNNGKT